MLTPQQVKKMRANLEMTQRELAEALGYDVRVVKYTESKNQKMSQRYERTLKNYYGRNFIPLD